MDAALYVSAPAVQPASAAAADRPAGLELHDYHTGASVYRSQLPGPEAENFVDANADGRSSRTVNRTWNTVVLVAAERWMNRGMSWEF